MVLREAREPSSVSGPGISNICWRLCPRHCTGGSRGLHQAPPPGRLEDGSQLLPPRAYRASPLHRPGNSQVEGAGARMGRLGAGSSQFPRGMSGKCVNLRAPPSLCTGLGAAEMFPQLSAFASPSSGSRCLPTGGNSPWPEPVGVSGFPSALSLDSHPQILSFR